MLDFEDSDEEYSDSESAYHAYRAKVNYTKSIFMFLK